MKTKIFSVFTSPILLIFSFSIIIVGSPDFGGPYLMFVIAAVHQGVLYGFLGVAGIMLALAGLFVQKRKLRVISVVLMILSLVNSFAIGPTENLEVTLFNWEPLLTMILFLTVAGFVVFNSIYWERLKF